MCIHVGVRRVKTAPESNSRNLDGNASSPLGGPAQQVATVLEGRGLQGALTSALLAAGLDPFLRIETVTAMIGLSIPTVYRLMAKGDFPRPVRLTTSARGWKLSNIVSWMQSRADASGQPAERS